MLLNRLEFICNAMQEREEEEEEDEDEDEVRKLRQN
jgi:hypothetical protein